MREAEYEKQNAQSHRRKEDAAPAQINLVWVLNKYPNVVPIPDPKNKERIIADIDSVNTELTVGEFKTLEESPNAYRVYGHGRLIGS